MRRVDDAKYCGGPEQLKRDSGKQSVDSSNSLPRGSSWAKEAHSRGDTEVPYPLLSEELKSLFQVVRKLKSNLEVIRTD